MKLKGKVLRRFYDTKDNNKIYDIQGNKEIEAYTNKEIKRPSIYIGEKDRYEELEHKGLVSKGELYEESKFAMKNKKEEK